MTGEVNVIQNTAEKMMLDTQVRYIAMNKKLVSFPASSYLHIHKLKI